jgi:dethiobiotin synthetase
MQFVVVGIGTDVGKTIVSAILVEKFKTSYWKPVQAGELDNSDSHKVARLTSAAQTIYPEVYRLHTPASPHYAAEIDGVNIQLSDFSLPTSEDLIIEAAGGLMVPLNQAGDLYLDLLKQWKLPVVLVSRHYLGSINHTLLSLSALAAAEVSVMAVVFVGDENSATESIISRRFPEIACVRVPLTENLDTSFVQAIAAQIKL